MVLLIVALATMLAAYMALQQNLWQRQLESQFNRVQAHRLAAAGIDWARAVLADDAGAGNIDYPGEMWAQPLPAIPLENGELTGAIEDQQGLFNLNDLVRGGVTSDADVARFQRLLRLLGLPPELANTLADWMDADNQVQQGGAEDSYYLSLPRPYRAANRPLVELSELLLVKGYDLQVLDRLRPYVTVLPEPTAINVNFASPEVMVAVLDNLTLPEARSVVQQRIGRPYRTVADFRERLALGQGQAPDTLITVSSQYFKVKGYVNVGHSQIKIDALLQRTGAGWPTVVWQSVQ